MKILNRYINHCHAWLITAAIMCIVLTCGTKAHAQSDDGSVFYHFNGTGAEAGFRVVSTITPVYTGEALKFTYSGDTSFKTSLYFAVNENILSDPVMKIRYKVGTTHAERASFPVKLKIDGEYNTDSQRMDKSINQSTTEWQEVLVDLKPLIDSWKYAHTDSNGVPIVHGNVQEIEVVIGKHAEPFRGRELSIDYVKIGKSLGVRNVQLAPSAHNELLADMVVPVTGSPVITNFSVTNDGVPLAIDSVTIRNNQLLVIKLQTPIVPPRDVDDLPNIVVSYNGSDPIIDSSSTRLQAFKHTLSLKDYADNLWKFWGKFENKAPRPYKAPWVATNIVADGWDWSLPDFVEASDIANFRYLRLPQINIPKRIWCNNLNNIKISWDDLEPEPGKYRFDILEKMIIDNSVGYDGVSVRVSGAVWEVLAPPGEEPDDFIIAMRSAPRWMDTMDIAKIRMNGSYVVNMDIMNPEYHNRYINFITELGKTNIPKMPQLKIVNVCYRSASWGEEFTAYNPENNTVEAQYSTEIVTQRTKERLKAWADAFGDNRHKLMYVGHETKAQIQYAGEVGIGSRNGFIEMYNSTVQMSQFGMNINADRYVDIDENNNFIKRDVAFGDENEEYVVPQDEKSFGWRESFPYRYYITSFRMLQMRRNYVMHAENTLNPELTWYVGLGLARRVEDTPDAFCLLSEFYISAFSNGGNKGAVKNVERWIYQRDVPGYITTPAMKVPTAKDLWYADNSKPYDFTARKGQKMGFDLDDRMFPAGEHEFAVKVSFYDGVPGTLSLKYENATGIKTESVTTTGADKVRTATFIIKSNLKPTSLKFDLELHSAEEVPVFFVRVIRTSPPLTLSTNAGTGGTIALNPPGGTYALGVPVTVTAKANLGYAFSDWSGNLTGSVNPSTLIMDGHKTVTANFTSVPTYELKTSGANGTVTLNPPGPIYNQGSVVTVTANPNSGFKFVDWSGNLSGSVNPKTVTMDGNRTVTANFIPIPTYTLTTSGVINGSVTLNPPGGSYKEGTVVTVSATPNSGYGFTNWSGNLTGATNPATINMNGNKTVAATFMPIVQPLSSGWVAGTLNTKVNGNARLMTVMVMGEHSGDFKAANVTYGGQLMKMQTEKYFGSTNRTYAGLFTLDEVGVNKATSGTIDVKWGTVSSTGSLSPLTTPSSGHAIYSVLLAGVDQASPVSAQNSNGLSGSSISTTPLSAALGDMVIMCGATENNNGDTTFNNGFTKMLEETQTTNWGDAVGGFKEGIGNSETPSFTHKLSGSERMVLCAMVVKKAVPKSFSLTTTTSNGTISLTPSKASYSENEVVTVTATPDAGFKFGNWTGDLTGSNSTMSITMSGNKSVTANFTPLIYTLTTPTGTNGTVTLNPAGGNYTHGQVVTVTATPDAGYVFDGWAGDLLGTNPSMTITMDADKSVTASFTPLIYTLTTSTGTNGTVTLNPAGGNYTHGQVVTVTASPKVGFTFGNWTGDLTGSNSTMSVTMTGNKSLTASFTPITYTLTTSAGANGTVTLNPAGGNYTHGQVVTVTATPDAGYVFDGWAGDLLGTNPSMTITMDADKSVTASFTLGARTWDGGGADNKWSTAENWLINTAPAGFLGLIAFAGDIKTTSNNDVAGLSTGPWNFTNDGSVGKTQGFVLNGAAVTLGNTMSTTAVVSGGAPITDTIKLDLVFSANRTVSTGTNHHLTIGGNVSESGGPLTLTKGGSATLTLTGDNTFTGPVLIDTGTLSVGSINSLGSGNSIRIGNAFTTGTLNYTGAGDSTTRTVQIGYGNTTSHTGGATISANGANGGTGLKFTAPTFNTPDSAAVVSARTLTLTGSNTDVNTIAGMITDGKAGTTKTDIAKAGSARWILGGANTYTGTTTVSGGVLQLNNAMALGGGNLYLNGGVLGLGAGDFTRSLGTAAGEVQMSTNTSGFAAYGSDRFVNIGGSSATLTFAATNFATNGLSLASSTSTHTLDFQNPLNFAGFVRTINVSNGTSNTNIDAILSGIISSSGGTNLKPPFRKSGTGTLMLTAQNTLGGNYQIVNGRLALGGATGNVIPNTGSVAVGANEFGTTSNCTFDLNGVAETIGGLTIGDTTAGTSGLVHSVGNTGAAAVLTLNGNITYNTGLDTNGKGTISANIGLGTATCNIGVNNVTANPVDLEISGQISGVTPANGIQKNNSGTLLLSASNTYTGGTFINDGTLMITGANQATSSYGFGGAGKLGFNIASPVTAANATVNFTGRTVLVEGTPTLPSYTLLTASSITGTPTLAAPAPAGYTLSVVGNKLLLVSSTSETAADPFLAWSATADFEADTNNDGIKNGLAWVLGASNPEQNANGLTTVSTNTLGGLKSTFTMLPASARNGAVVEIEYGSDLALADSWTRVVVPDVSGTSGNVTFVVTGTNPLNVEATISSSEAEAGSLFSRLKITK